MSPYLGAEMARQRVQIYENGKWGVVTDKVGHNIVKDMTITPLMAQDWLDKRNQMNRKFKTRQITTIMREILKGRWHDAGNFISFYQNGQLADGQNRLAAIVKADRPVVTKVVFGVSKAARMCIDTGVARSLTDRTALSGHSWSGKSVRAGKYMLEIGAYVEGTKKTIYDDEVVSLMKAYGDTFETFATLLKSKTFGKQPAVAALSYVALENPEHAAELEEFAQQYNDGLNISCQESPVARIRNFSTEASKNLSGEDRRKLFLKMVAAARMSLTDKTIKKLFAAQPDSINVSAIHRRKL